MTAPARRMTAGSPAGMTLLVGAATALGIFPLGVLFTDNRWFVESLGAIVVVLGPAAAVRWRRGSTRSSDLLPGVVLLIVYAFVLYLHRGSLLGILPGSGTVERLRELQQQNRDIIQHSVTPIRSTPGLRLYVIPAVGLIAAVTDWLTNVRRAPALAGVSFLAVFTVAGAINGAAVGWWQFGVGACGYLVLLVVASRRETAEWGRVVPRAGQSRDLPLQLSASGARIGAIAIVLAVIVPAAVPGLDP